MKRSILYAAVVSLLVTSHAYAAIITTPTSLSPGDSYRLVFVTSGGRNAHSTNIADYNAFVQGIASAAGSQVAGLSTTWRAIGSTSSVDAWDNTNTNPSIATGVSIFNLNGEEVAEDNSDLWDGSTSASIGYDELGGFRSGWVWSGTGSDGTGNAPLGKPAGLGVKYGHSGIAGGAAASQWISSSGWYSQAEFPLYAISGVLTIASVPEPSSFFIFLGLAGMGGLWMRVQRRRHKQAVHS